MILLLCLMLSHGSMGVAVPHAHNDQSAHAPHDSGHHHDTADDGDSADDERTSAPEATGHHIHLIGDVSSASTAAVTRLMRHTLIMQITSDAPPGSLRTPPLLEPPSA
ncbi:hypothetical protein [Blastomonas sp. RAC04]|uniref:hypothetical protein n=1 Tax=Blastomonas sp. RAC04 TaxID=1842535 RepID=UPI0012371EE8|nr:hypothetical protein [Blastomonas sp. RAC04]